MVANNVAAIFGPNSPKTTSKWQGKDFVDLEIKDFVDLEKKSLNENQFQTKFQV